MNDNDLIKQLIDSLLEDRKNDKKYKFYSRLIFLSFFVVILILIFLPDSNNSSFTDKHIAVVDVQGVIAPASPSSVSNIIPYIKKAADNENCLGIILKINSPGGSATQSKIIFDEIVKIRSTSDKPIYSVIEDMGTSGGYYVAASTEKIFSSSSSIVGSIGVRLDSYNIKELMTNLGIKSQTLSAGRDKLILNPFDDLTPEHKAHILLLLNDIHSQFISDIKKSRGEKLTNNDIFTGLFWTGAQAKDIGLIDEVASIYDVTDKYFDNNKLINYNKKDKLIDKLFGKVSNLISNQDQAYLKY